MAGRTMHKRDRQPGWPPGRADHYDLWQFPSDGLVLAILWALVTAGLVVLLAFVALGLIGAMGRLV